MVSMGRPSPPAPPLKGRKPQVLPSRSLVALALPLAGEGGRQAGRGLPFTTSQTEMEVLLK